MGLPVAAGIGLPVAAGIGLPGTPYWIILIFSSPSRERARARVNSFNSPLF